MRLFVAVWPPPAVVAQLESFTRAEDPTVRWTTAAEWHVTLLFLGQVAPQDRDGVVLALGTAARMVSGPVAVEVGPQSAILGRGILYLPVVGLDALAASTREALGDLDADADERAFRGHLTLARSRGGHPMPRELAGAPFAASWDASEIALVESVTAPGGARYTTIATSTLT